MRETDSVSPDALTNSVRTQYYWGQRIDAEPYKQYVATLPPPPSLVVPGQGNVTPERLYYSDGKLYDSAGTIRSDFGVSSGANMFNKWYLDASGTVISRDPAGNAIQESYVPDLRYGGQFGAIRDPLGQRPDRYVQIVIGQPPVARAAGEPPETTVRTLVPVTRDVIVDDPQIPGSFARVKQYQGYEVQYVPKEHAGAVEVEPGSVNALFQRTKNDLSIRTTDGTGRSVLETYSLQGLANGQNGLSYAYLSRTLSSGGTDNLRIEIGTRTDGTQYFSLQRQVIQASDLVDPSSGNSPLYGVVGWVEDRRVSAVSSLSAPPSNANAEAVPPPPIPNPPPSSSAPPPQPGQPAGATPPKPNETPTQPPRPPQPAASPPAPTGNNAPAGATPPAEAINAGSAPQAANPGPAAAGGSAPAPTRPAGTPGPASPTVTGPAAGAKTGAAPPERREPAGNSAAPERSGGTPAPTRNNQPAPPATERSGPAAASRPTASQPAPAATPEERTGPATAAGPVSATQPAAAPPERSEPAVAGGAPTIAERSGPATASGTNNQPAPPAAERPGPAAASPPTAAQPAPAATPGERTGPATAAEPVSAPEPAAAPPERSEPAVAGGNPTAPERSAAATVTGTENRPASPSPEQPGPASEANPSASEPAPAFGERTGPATAVRPAAGSQADAASTERSEPALAGEPPAAPVRAASAPTDTEPAVPAGERPGPATAGAAAPAPAGNTTAPQSGERPGPAVDGDDESSNSERPTPGESRERVTAADREAVQSIVAALGLFPNEDGTLSRREAAAGPRTYELLRADDGHVFVRTADTSGGERYEFHPAENRWTLLTAGETSGGTPIATSVAFNASEPPPDYSDALRLVEWLNLSRRGAEGPHYFTAEGDAGLYYLTRRTTGGRSAFSIVYSFGDTRKRYDEATRSWQDLQRIPPAAELVSARWFPPGEPTAARV